MDDTKIAQEAKEKGNAAFRTGDYFTAVGQYTTAILNNRNDPTYPLNRAAAYLKLGKNEDADRDCTTVLKLNASNVKALFRRGQARMNMGQLVGAQEDFQNALTIEPGNEVVKQEKAKLDEMITQINTKAKGLSTDFSFPGKVHKRRRVPITIVDTIETDSQNSTKPGFTSGKPTTLAKDSNTISPGGDLMKPVSSRPLSVQTTSPASARMTSKPTFSEVRQARESAKPSRVGGGIFRSTGQATILRDPSAAEYSAPSQKPSFSTPSSIAPLTPPGRTQVRGKPSMSLFEFTKAWESLKYDDDRWRLVKEVVPEQLPSMFQTSLEPSLFVSLVATFLAILTRDPSSVGLVREYMDSFAQVPRFATVLLFLDSKEKDVVKEVWNLLGVQNAGSIWSVVL